MRELRSELRRGVLLGAPLGYLTGLALYGGIGYLVAGQTGLWVGGIIATGFAVAGLAICLRYVEALTR
jgi:hypothetical protein